jgi:ABC-2 type transport system ATP-binding protein
MNECIVIQGLEMHFRGCDALRGVDLVVPQGSVFALLGENGAGKTTLIRILTGFQHPSKGTCRILGLDPINDALALRRRIGYVADAPALYDWMRVDEIGWFASSFYPEGFVDRYRESVQRYDLPLDRKIKNLSKGQRAKVALSLSTAHDPELLILDEPTSGLDPLVRREFMESMVERAANGQTVLLSSHQISEVERVADYIAILHKGKVQIAAPLSELRDSIFEVTISRADPLAALPDLAQQPSSSAEVLYEKIEGRQVRWIVKNYQGSHEKLLAEWPNVLAVRSRPATLEELFIACTRGMNSSSSSASATQSGIGSKADRQAS